MRAAARRIGAALLRAMVAVGVANTLAALASYAWFDLRYSPQAVLRDAALAWPFVAGAALAARWRFQPWLLAAAIAALLLPGHAAKLAMMGAPLEPGDLFRGVELLGVLHGWRLAFACALPGAWLLALVVGLLPALRRAPWLLVSAAWLVVVLQVLPPRLAREPAAEPGRARALVAAGGTTYLLRALGQRQAELADVPDRAEVAAAIARLGLAPYRAPGAFHARAIHAFLLESVWDPTRLRAYAFSQDPFDPAFRAAWTAGGSSTVVTPVFGGATANAEFEFLCALPAMRDDITFEQAVRNPMPCLPRVLREAGYRTVAIHPYRASYWSRDRAYPLLGFEAYRSLRAFEADDLDGAFLADASTYRQEREWAASLDDARPGFTWLVSLSSHYPFDRDHKRRPDIVQVTPAAPMLQAYANAVRYTTAAFMAEARAILEADPDAIIVAFGDHAPVLGTDPDPYAASGMPVAAGPDNALAQIAQTPLLVIDGRRGPVPMGSLPLYELAPRLLALLGPGHPTLPQVPAEPLPDVAEGRVFFNAMLVREGDGWRRCRRGEQACERAIAVRKARDTLRADLGHGHRHALALLDARAFARWTPMELAGDHPRCGLDVASWGPQTTPAGEPFNPQPNGGSAFWFQLREGARGRPQLEVAGQRAPLTLVGKAASAGFADPAWIRQPGRYAVEWVCGDGTRGTIGTFTVTAPEA